MNRTAPLARDIINTSRDLMGNGEIEEYYPDFSDDEEEEIAPKPRPRNMSRTRSHGMDFDAVIEITAEGLETMKMSGSFDGRESEYEEMKSQILKAASPKKRVQAFDNSCSTAGTSPSSSRAKWGNLSSSPSNSSPLRNGGMGNKLNSMNTSLQRRGSFTNKLPPPSNAVSSPRDIKTRSKSDVGYLGTTPPNSTLRKDLLKSHSPSSSRFIVMDSSKKTTPPVTPNNPIHKRASTSSEDNVLASASVSNSLANSLANNSISNLLVCEAPAVTILDHPKGRSSSNFNDLKVDTSELSGSMDFSQFSDSPSSFLGTNKSSEGSIDFDKDELDELEDSMDSFNEGDFVDYISS